MKTTCPAFRTLLATEGGPKKKVRSSNIVRSCSSKLDKATTYWPTVNIECKLPLEFLKKSCSGGNHDLKHAQTTMGWSRVLKRVALTLNSSPAWLLLLQMICPC